MEDNFLILAEKAVPTGWTPKVIGKLGVFTSRCYITEAIMGESW